MRASIETSIIINASAKRIWGILVDTGSYGEWNPLISSLEGDLQTQSKLKVNVLGSKFTPTIIEYTKDHILKWQGKLFFKGLFDGEHTFALEDNKDGTCIFYHTEQFNGILVGLLIGQINGKFKNSFDAMNRALKEKAERK